jgi:hypothetical protein
MWKAAWRAAYEIVDRQRLISRPLRQLQPSLLPCFR